MRNILYFHSRNFSLDSKLDSIKIWDRPQKIWRALMCDLWCAFLGNSILPSLHKSDWFLSQFEAKVHSIKWSSSIWHFFIGCWFRSSHKETSFIHNWSSWNLFRMESKCYWKKLENRSRIFGKKLQRRKTKYRFVYAHLDRADELERIMNYF